MQYFANFFVDTPCRVRYAVTMEKTKTQWRFFRVPALTKEQERRMKRLVDAQGMKLGAWVRQAIVEKMEREDARM